MEGYYQNTQLSPQELQRQSSQNQFRQQMQPQQHQQSQQRPDVPSNEVQMMHDAINMARNASSGQPNGHGQESINNVDSAFDDMMRDNQNEHQRRRSMPQSFHSTLAQDSQNRRLSSIDPGEMMTFGNDGDLNSYQFNQNMSSGYPTLDTSNMSMGNHMGNYMTDPADFSISPDMMGSMIPSTFANMSMGNMGNNPSGMDLFSNNAVTSAPMASQFSTNSMGQISNDFSMDMSPDNAPLSATPSNAPHHMLGALEDGGENMLDMNSPLNPQMNAQLNQQMNAQLQQQMNSQLNQQLDRQMNQHMNNQMNQQMNQQMNNQMNQQINNQANNQMNRRTNSQIDQQANSRPNSQSNNQTNNQLNSQVNSQIDSNDPVVQHQPRPQPGMRVDSNMGNSSQTRPTPLSRHISSPNSVISPVQANSSSSIAQQSSSSDATTPVTNPTSRESKEKTIYSKSGFDMLKALWLVATRKNPQIHLGAVDMSCAFVVCDVQMNDCPIIYVSDNFQNLTGYSRHEIVGQNCRFLQAPDGQVEAGTKREFVDEGAVYNLKKMIQEGREVQQSLINYRKGGKPFLNLLTMIPIPWDTDEIRYFIGFQIDLVECPDAISSGQEMGGVKVNYKHSVVGQYIWTPPNTSQYESETGQTLGVDDVSTLLQQFSPKGMVSDWHKQSWDKMLLENADDVVHVLSLKGLFLYLSPACKRVLEYDATELVGSSLSSVCHPSDIVPVTRELKDTAAGSQVNIVFRIRRKNSGYTWFESHGSLFVEQGKGRKCIILVGRKRPVFALSRRNLEAHGGIGDSELWTKISTSGMFLYVSSNIRSLLDLQPEALVGTSIQELMRKESRPEFGRAIEKARRGRTVSCKHEVQNRRGQVLQAQTTLFPGDASDGQKPSFLLAQTKLLKASSRNLAPASVVGSAVGSAKSLPSTPQHSQSHSTQPGSGTLSAPAGGGLPPGSQDAALASDDNIFDELRTTKCSSWQFELRQMEKVNRILAEELGGLLANKKKRKRRKGVGNIVRDCANCHTRSTPEWRRGPSGQRDLCNSCGLRWAKQTGRVSPRNSSRGGNNGNGDSHSKKSASPVHSSPLHRETSAETGAQQQGMNGDGGVNPAHLTHQNPNPGGTAPSGASSAIGAKPSTTMPPPSQPMLSGGAAGSAMTSIREERETSQP